MKKWNALFSNLFLEHSSELWMLEMFALFFSSFSLVGLCWPQGNAIYGTKLFSKFSLLSTTPCFITVTKYQRLKKQQQQQQNGLGSWHPKNMALLTSKVGIFASPSTSEPRVCSHGHSLTDVIPSLRSTFWRVPHLNSTVLTKLPVYRLWQDMLSCMQTTLPMLWKIALAFGSSL